MRSGYRRGTPTISRCRASISGSARASPAPRKPRFTSICMYQRLLQRPVYARAAGTVSFTLPIRLPAAGSSLRLWPSCTYPADVAHLNIARSTSPEVVVYHLGSALVHSGHVLHQIGPTPSVQPEDLRVMLQGHGLVVDHALILYW